MIIFYGYVSAKKQFPKETVISYIERFAPKINNWAICDTFCSGMKIITKDLDFFWNPIVAYIKMGHEFEVRMSIVFLMNYYLNERYLKQIFKICDTIKT